MNENRYPRKYRDMMKMTLVFGARVYHESVLYEIDEYETSEKNRGSIYRKQCAHLGKNM
jgi:hypothetical protein